MIAVVGRLAAQLGEWFITSRAAPWILAGIVALVAWQFHASAQHQHEADLARQAVEARQVVDQQAQQAELSEIAHAALDRANAALAAQQQHDVVAQQLHTQEAVLEEHAPTPALVVDDINQAFGSTP